MEIPHPKEPRGGTATATSGEFRAPARQKVTILRKTLARGLPTVRGVTAGPCRNTASKYRARYARSLRLESSRRVRVCQRTHDRHAPRPAGTSYVLQR